MADPKITTQIEQTADYYPPATYTGATGGYQSVISRLTHYNEWVFDADTLADEFIPISTVSQRGRNPKIFAIGVIPPSANVTGRVLDRSASVPNTVNGNPTYASTTGQSTQDRSTFVKSLLEYACNPPRGRSENDPIYQDVTEGRDKGAAQKSYSSCGDLAHWMLYRLGVRSDFVNRDENGGWKDQVNISNLAFSPAAKVPSPNQQYKPGDIIIIWSNDSGTDAHAIVVSEQTSANKLTTGEYGQPGGAIKDRTIKTENGKPFIGKRQIQRVIPLEDVVAMAKEQGKLADVTLPTNLGPAAPDPTRWDGKAAAQARDILGKTSNTPLQADQLLTFHTIAQRAMALELQKTLQAMAETPPLRLLVNPSSFSVKGEKIVADSGWSRNGSSIVEHWGNNQEKISASGKVAGFYAIDALNAVGPGLTRTARNFSQSWQNFQSLLAFYANNGGIHLTDLAEQNLSMVGSIYIYYDNIMYVGAFDSLSVSETETAPHTVDYNFEFSVRAAFLMDGPSPSGQTYGVAQASNQQPITSTVLGR